MKTPQILTGLALMASALAMAPFSNGFTYVGSGRLITEPGIDYSRLDPSAVPGVTPWTSQLDANLAGSTHTGPIVSNPLPDRTAWRYDLIGAGLAQFAVGNYSVFDTVEGFALTITKIDGDPVGVFDWALVLAGNYIYTGTPVVGAPESMNVPILNNGGGTEFVDFTSSGLELFGYVAGLFGQVDTGSGSDVPDLYGIISLIETSAVTVDGNYVASYFGKPSATGEFMIANFNGRDLQGASKVPDSGSTVVLMALGMMGLFFVRRFVKRMP